MRFQRGRRHPRLSLATAQRRQPTSQQLFLAPGAAGDGARETKIATRKNAGEKRRNDFKVDSLYFIFIFIYNYIYIVECD